MADATELEADVRGPATAVAATAPGEPMAGAPADEPAVRAADPDDVALAAPPPARLVVAAAAALRLWAVDATAAADRACACVVAARVGDARPPREGEWPPFSNSRTTAAAASNIASGATTRPNP